MAARFDLTNTGYEVRPAAPADLAAVRMLLPKAPADCTQLVAVDGQQGLVIGALAATKIFRDIPFAGPGIALHVIPSCRRHGVARGLLQRATDLAAERSAQGLYAMQRVVAGSDEAKAWRWLGFNVLESVEQHRLPLDRFEPRLAPLVERMRRSGKIPDAAHMIPLYRADAQAVLRLHLSEMGGQPESLSRKLIGEGPGAFHPRYSRVLLLGEEVIGCILAHRSGPDVAVVDANIVAPPYRNGWANIWLKLEATRGALSLGIKYFHFTSFDHYEDTRSFTKKLGGATTTVEQLMFRSMKT